MYDLNLVRVLSHDIAKNNESIFCLNNLEGCLTNVPLNHYLFDTNKLRKYCKDVIKGMNPKAIVHYIEDEDLEISIVGGYLEAENDYHILVNPNHNTCWRRFALVKELCSLYTNHYGRVKGDWQMQTVDDYLVSLESSYNQIGAILNNDLNTNDLDSDTFAILMATELMIPPFKRKLTNSLVDRYKKSELTLNDIAQSLSMPEQILQKHIEFGYFEGGSDYYASH